MNFDVLDIAAALIKAGRMAEAQKLLEPFIEGNLQNIPAWLLEAETWLTAARKKKVLELCLRYNPDAIQIHHALAVVETKLADDSRQQSSKDGSRKLADIPRNKISPGINFDTIVLGLAFIIVVCLLAWVYLSTKCIDLPGESACLRVLFIGNSYTSVNDLPNMFADLARSGGHQVETGVLAEGGATLSQHANSPATIEKLKSTKWDFVVLQEQSQIPSIERSRLTSMFPAARLLVRQIKDAGAKPVFFLTWAHRDGWPENGMQGFESMQFQLDEGYLIIAQELRVPVASVGYVWMLAKRQNPELKLWQADGIHPTEQGTYLAACVFYATLFRESPEGLKYVSHLPKEIAQELQMIAANAVLKNPKLWNLP